MDIQIPSNVYVGKNVVRRHLLEFLQQTSQHGLLTNDEQLMAVFDCVLMEGNGTRLGGLTLHDYALLTNQSMITWGRGRNRDVMDKFAWIDITVEKFGRRNLIEGVVKFSYRVRPVGPKRRISLRTKNDDEAGPKDSMSEENGPRPGNVELYLDLMPLEEVEICQKMMNYFIKNRADLTDPEEFFSTFRREMGDSFERLTSVPVGLRSLYVQQPNGIYVEADDTEEENLYQSLRTPVSRHPNPPASPYQGSEVKRGYSSPYQLGNTRPAASSARVSEDSRKKETGIKSSPKIPGIGSSPVYNGPSKLDALEQNPGKPPKPQVYRTRQEPAAPRESVVSYNPPEKRSAPPVQPVRKPAPEPLDEAQAAARVQPPTAVTSAIAISRNTLNVYSISRLAHGLFEGRQNFSRNITDASDTAAILASIPGIFSNNMKDRQTSLLKLRAIMEGGYLENNVLLKNAVVPLMKPLIDKFSPFSAANQAPVQQRSRVSVRMGANETESAPAPALNPGLNPGPSRPATPLGLRRSAPSAPVETHIPIETEDENPLLKELPLMGEEVATDELVVAAPVASKLSLKSKRVADPAPAPAEAAPAVTLEAAPPPAEVAPAAEVAAAEPAPEPKKIKLGVGKK